MNVQRYFCPHAGERPGRCKVLRHENVTDYLKWGLILAFQ